MCKKFFLILFLIFSFTAPLSAQKVNSMFQVAPFSSLMVGLYQGFYSIGDLSQNGDFGLGTFDGLDGEMIAYQGKYYYIDQKGMTHLAAPSVKVPFAQVVFFQPQSQISVQNIPSFIALNQWLKKNITFQNQSYAVLIKGKFNQLKLRSLRKQSMPYPDLLTAAESQVVYTFKEVEGVAVGFWSPSYWGTVTVEGLHIHFIDQTLQKGGHVLDLSIEGANIYLMPIDQINIFLPNNPVFNQANLNEATQENIQKVEGAF